MELYLSLNVYATGEITINTEKTITEKQAQKTRVQKITQENNPRKQPKKITQENNPRKQAGAENKCRKQVQKTITNNLKL